MMITILKNKDYSVSITFSNRELYQLFLRYLHESTIDLIRDRTDHQALYEYSVQHVNDPNSTITLRNVWGTGNIVGQFCLIVDIEVPKNYQSEYYNPTYRQPVMSYPEPRLSTMYGRDVGKVQLGRQGVATIPRDLMTDMLTFNDDAQVSSLSQVSMFTEINRTTRESIVTPKPTEHAVSSCVVA